MKKKIYHRNNVTTGRALFKRWLANSERVDEKTSEDYIEVLVDLNNYVKERRFKARDLFSADKDTVVETIKELLHYPGFDDYLKLRTSDRIIILKALDSLLSYEKYLLNQDKVTSDKWEEKKSTLYVHRGKISCQSFHHNTVPVTAVLLGRNDKNVELTVNYCKDCHIFFIDEQSYQTYRKRYGVLIGNIKFENMEKPFRKDDSTLALESPLMLCGYNVRQQGGLTKEERQYVISRIIDRGIMTKMDVITYLRFFIKRNGKKENNYIAAKKRQEDLEFTLEYKKEQQAKAPIKIITKYKRR